MPGQDAQAAMELVYPRFESRLYLPVELDGSLGHAVFKAAHRQGNKQIHWHLDDQYLGKTSDFHQMALRPAPGKHKLVLVDEDGARLERTFEILSGTTGGR